jgi:hypothetical protein
LRLTGAIDLILDNFAKSLDAIVGEDGGFSAVNLPGCKYFCRIANCARSAGVPVSWARSLTVNPRSTLPPQGCATSPARHGRPRDI